MTDPTPLYYQTPPPTSNDISNLKVLGILHYVWGGMIMLFSCFGIIYIVLGIVIVSGGLNSPPPPTMGPTPGVGPGSPYVSRPAGSAIRRPAPSAAGPPPEMGYLFIGLGGCAVLFGWAIGICAIISGRKMAARQSRIFSIVIAGINCMWFPLGTLLGVFTIIVLSKQSVKDLYAGLSSFR